ncbi:unnamed protein product [Mytilus edulis]|uniref:VLIG-type G domain-containing protein n=1 Tax=Mytilus edulis TaxID=6550 RepID=A0A8S3UXE9_MYTED|nr:unnamed protein product [Mytilus edulis]
MRECIRKMIDTKPLSSISYRLISSNLKTQEDIGCYQDVKQQVKNLWGVLPDKFANVKKQVIPVQGKPWKAWTKNQKAFQNSSLYKNQSVAGAIQKEMIEERKKQVELCQKIDPFMKTFIDCLEDFVESENNCHVFVMLVKDLLDGRSRQVLPHFKSQYLFDWCSLKLAKEQQTKQIVIDNLLAKAQQSEKELSEASFGFEHLCRELAQMFEALSECTILPTDQQKYVNILPKMAARLLLMGQPFELMDGDVTNVPMLATFVVGLGDIIIVNVKGENTTEVKDVLQIVVHAFLRLRLANRKSILKQRCIFAHQNVPAQDAIEKMRHGRQKFIETLDLMTKEAAVQEKIVDIQTFNQVIQLDIEKDIWYFSDLWRGDPPMAPANPGYSETVADALTAITERLIIDRETYLTITDTVTRIQDLWSGILTDDFVFSFRNSLEFKAYNDMERYYHSLTWRLEQSVQEFLKLSRLVNDAVQEATKEINSFIRNNGLKDIMIQWQQGKQMKFKFFGEELITLAKLDVFNFIEESKVKKKRLADMTLHEHEINRQAELIAVKMKGSFRNKDMIQQAFNKMWNGWISQFDTKASRHIRSIKEQIELLIHNRFPADVAYLKEVDQKILNMICDAFDDHNENKQNRYHFNLTNAFRACVCSHVKWYLSMFFETLDEKYNQKHSQKAVMEEEDGCNLYANFAKARIQNLFPKIAKAISEANEACKMENHETISQWIDFFVRIMNQNKIPISNDKMVHVKSRNVSKLDSFIEILKQQLEDIKNKVTSIFEKTREDTVLWDENPVPKIMLKLWGCSETCMFCKEPCINTDKDHVDRGHAHKCLQHRPQGIGGYNLEQTSKLCVAYCNHLVGTEQTYIWNRGAVDEERRKFREYKEHFPDWDIPHSLDKCQFWMWIMCKYKDELIEMYCADLSDIPESWPLITKQQALESLSVYMAD